MPFVPSALTEMPKIGVTDFLPAVFVLFLFYSGPAQEDAIAEEFDWYANDNHSQEVRG